MTAHPSPENVQRIIDCGARACLAKPLDMEALLTEVRASL
jgi:AmiR/NasT family two-component response regulator